MSQFNNIKNELELNQNANEAVDFINQDDIEQVENDNDDGMDVSDNEQEGDQNDQMRGDEEGEQIEFEDDSVQGFFNHKEPVYDLAIHPKYQNVVGSGGGDDKTYLWNMTNGEVVHEFPKHKDSVISVGFNHDGKYFASGGMDGIIQVVEVESGKLVTSLEGPEELTWVQWHPKGNVIICGSVESTVWMFKVPSGECMNVFVGHSGPVTCGTFTHDGKKIVSGSEDGSLFVWDPVTAQPLIKITSEDARFHQGAITSLSVSLDNRVIVTGGEDGSCRVVLLGNGSILASLDGHNESIECIDYCSTMNIVATGSVDGKVNLWDLTSFKLRSTLSHDEQTVTSLTWVPNSHLLITGSMDGLVRQWDARTGQQVKVWKGHEAAILSLSCTKDGTTVISGSDDGNCLVFLTQ